MQLVHGCAGRTIDSAVPASAGPPVMIRRSARGAGASTSGSRPDSPPAAALRAVDALRNTTVPAHYSEQRAWDALIARSDGLGQASVLSIQAVCRLRTRDPPVAQVATARRTPSGSQGVQPGSATVRHHGASALLRLQYGPIMEQRRRLGRPCSLGHTGAKRGPPPRMRASARGVAGRGTAAVCDSAAARRERAVAAAVWAQHGAAASAGPSVQPRPYGRQTGGATAHAGIASDRAARLRCDAADSIERASPCLASAFAGVVFSLCVVIH